MEDIINILLKNIEEQFRWRMEDSECARYEVEESFNILKSRICDEVISEVKDEKSRGFYISLINSITLHP